MGEFVLLKGLNWILREQGKLVPSAWLKYSFLRTVRNPILPNCDKRAFESLILHFNPLYTIEKCSLPFSCLFSGFSPSPRCLLSLLLQLYNRKHNLYLDCVTSIISGSNCLVCGRWFISVVLFLKKWWLPNDETFAIWYAVNTGYKTYRPTLIRKIMVVYHSLCRQTCNP